MNVVIVSLLHSPCDLQQLVGFSAAYLVLNCRQIDVSYSFLAPFGWPASCCSSSSSSTLDAAAGQLATLTLSIIITTTTLLLLLLLFVLPTLIILTTL